MPLPGGAAVQVTQHGGYEPIEGPDGSTVYYLSANRPSALKSIAYGGGQESVVLPSIRPHSWGVSHRGIWFLSAAAEHDALERYDLSTRRVELVGRLKFRVAWNGDINRFTVSSDGHWALATRHDRFDTDLMMIDNFR
jgi:hypothetical protein